MASCVLSWIKRSKAYLISMMAMVQFRRVTRGIDFLWWWRANTSVWGRSISRMSGYDVCRSSGKTAAGNFLDVPASGSVEVLLVSVAVLRASECR